MGDDGYIPMGEMAHKNGVQILFEWFLLLPTFQTATYQS